MDDQKIVELFQQNKQDRAFYKLYKDYPKIEKLILSKGGSKEDAKDIFQEALLIFYQKARVERFKLSSSIGTYLYSVCHFLWKDELIKRKGKKQVTFDFDYSAEEEKEYQDALEREQKFQQIERVLTQIGEKCLQLLKLFYYHGLKMKDIAPKMGLKSEKITKNQKYKCIERAKLKLKNA